MKIRKESVNDTVRKKPNIEFNSFPMLRQHFKMSIFLIEYVWDFGCTNTLIYAIGTFLKVITKQMCSYFKQLSPFQAIVVWKAKYNEDKRCFWFKTFSSFLCCMAHLLHNLYIPCESVLAASCLFRCKSVYKLMITKLI